MYFSSKFMFSTKIPFCCNSIHLRNHIFCLLLSFLLIVLATAFLHGLNTLTSFSTEPLCAKLVLQFPLQGLYQRYTPLRIPIAVLLVCPPTSQAAGSQAVGVHGCHTTLHNNCFISPERETKLLIILHIFSGF